MEQQKKLQEDEDACVYAMQLASSSVLPMVLRSVVELGILEIITKAGPVGTEISPSEIASQLPTQNPDAAVMVDRALRLLASYSVVTCSLKTHEDGRIERVYGEAPICKLFLQNEETGSLEKLMLMHQDKVLMHGWFHMKEAILEGGIPFHKEYGMSAFEYQGVDPRFNVLFNEAMKGQTIITMNKLLQVYKGFEGLNSVVDVGGGFAVALKMITSKYPSIKGINFDLPYVVAEAPSHPGVEHVGGNMFESVPKGDAIFMKLILHDWSDEHCLTILKNCYEALPKGGKVIIVDALLSEAAETNRVARAGYQIDNLMMMINPGGKERTEKDFEALAKGAGFRSYQVICPVINLCAIEYVK
ncbi:caffeic acid 3-O-methyltransferase-like [Macadamia integrifolia]|uniref:caffeic acid 3-O-methyltransferase-like n=1 Tax=Macadamia integrifolia TaxID=60698 RepID=UPI001C4E4386|nr:caffeic acid 3-O-methyltransferase-like [Macadamia integrifolia]XP_042509051.1 caffeic acid 3-O-methyltransferase-like [Macadamia integrifolia]